MNRATVRLAMAALGVLLVSAAANGEWAPGSVHWPDDCGYVNVREQGAKGDGRTDDTAAIRKVLAEKNAVGIYFPPGTYLVSDTLLCGSSKRHFIQGAGPDRTLIRLKDRAPGFGDRNRPKAVFQNYDQPIGKGRNGQAFRNSYHDLAVEIGPGNSGAIGILYFNNNQGSMMNVRVKAAKGSGFAGVAMAQGWPGPALFRHLQITGCEYGIWSTIHQYSFTLEHVRLSGQRRAGLCNTKQRLFVRGLASRQASGVPEIENGSGMLLVIDSDLTGSGPAAITSKSDIFLRNVKTSGYKLAAKAKSGSVSGPHVTEHAASVLTFSSVAKTTLNLPVEESPTADWSKPSDWVSVAKYGAKGGDGEDDTEGIQRAIDSGARVVYLPRGFYDINGTVRVRGKVERLCLMESSVATGTDKTPGWDADKPVFRVEDGDSPFVIIEKFEGRYGTGRPVFEQATTRTLVLRTVVPRGSLGYRNVVPGGKLFLDDYCGGQLTFDRMTVYARQFNPENKGRKIHVKGGRFWVLGLKTERAGEIVRAEGGAEVEVLGGYIYRNRGKTLDDGTKPDAFINVGSSMSVCGIAGDSTCNEIRGGSTKVGKAGSGVYVGRP